MNIHLNAAHPTTWANLKLVEAATAAIELDDANHYLHFASEVAKEADAALAAADAAYAAAVHHGWCPEAKQADEARKAAHAKACEAHADLSRAESDVAAKKVSCVITTRTARRAAIDAIDALGELTDAIEGDDYSDIAARMKAAADLIRAGVSAAKQALQDDGYDQE